MLIVIAAVESALEVALRDDARRAPRTTPWFAVPAIAHRGAAAARAPSLALRRAGGLWLLAAAFSFVDGRLVVFARGDLRRGHGRGVPARQPARRASRRGSGLAVVLGAAAIIVYNDPRHAAGEYVFIPALFAIGWLAGFALRERSEQAEAAEERATQAERERETPRRASRWPRSARGSRASCTTSSPTPSA